MPSSLSFDRAADYYDQTRDLPEPVATQGISALFELAGGPAARILDVGAGTGRIGVPLLQRSANWFGCDLSTRMMARLRSKAPAARLAQADASRLPYPAASFDALLTVHVMHLVGPWREALREYRRVLRPGGVYLNAHTERDGEIPRFRINQYFRERVKALGHADTRPGVRDDADLYDELVAMGAELRHIDAVSYAVPADTPRDALAGLAARTNSHTWDIPDDLFAAVYADTQRWAAAQYPDLDAPISASARFVIDIAVFAKSNKVG